MEQRPLVAVGQAESEAQRRGEFPPSRAPYGEAPSRAPYGEAPNRATHGEEVQRVQVEPEDRLAFRVGVNILTLALLVLAGYLVWRNFFQ